MIMETAVGKRQSSRSCTTPRPCGVIDRRLSVARHSYGYYSAGEGEGVNGLATTGGLLFFPTFHVYLNSLTGLSMTRVRARDCFARLTRRRCVYYFFPPDMSVYTLYRTGTGAMPFGFDALRRASRVCVCVAETAFGVFLPVNGPDRVTVENVEKSQNQSTSV